MIILIIIILVVIIGIMLIGAGVGLYIVNSKVKTQNQIQLPQPNILPVPASIDSSTEINVRDQFTTLIGDVRFFNLFTINGIKKTIWLVLISGTFNDYEDWTNIPLNGNDDKNKQKNVPINKSIQRLIKIEYGKYYDLTFPYEGGASYSYRIRVNCDENMNNCEMGDSVRIETDPKEKNNYKPPLDTKIEFSPGCALVEDDFVENVKLSKCFFNPSIIQAKADLQENALKWYTKGGKIEADGTPSSLYPFEASIGNTTFFDVSAVDGYTVPVIVYIKRPTSTTGNINFTNVKCTVNNDKKRLDTDDITLLMDCGNLDASKGCPIENINPPLLMHNAADKYSNNNSNQPLINFDQSILNSVPQNSKLDLTYYRDPKDTKLLYTTDIIGCAQPCTAFTHREAHSQNYPKGGYQFPPSYIRNPNSSEDKDIPTSSTLGINQICATGKVSSFGSKTSKEWYKTGDNTEMGYYIKNFPPEADINGNPYYDPNNGSSYVNKIDTAGIQAPCRAYAWAYNDELKNISFQIADPTNTKEVMYNGTRKKVYQQYKMLVVIGTSLNVYK